MRLEHNNKVALATSDLGRYGTKIKPYTQLAKGLLKQLLVEQNRLKENIRWANHTPGQWKAVSQLSFEEQNVIYQTLFGDKNVEKIKTTKATSSELNELKAINLDTLSASLSSDPTEDFTSYTETDPNSNIAVTADTITFTNVRAKYDTFYVYKDKGAAHFDGSFEHLHKHYATAVGDTCSISSWLLSNVLGDENYLRTNSYDMLNYKLYYDAANGRRMYMAEMDGASFYWDYYTGWLLSTVYYIEVERDENVGTYGTLYARICTGNYYGLGGSLVDTLSITLHTSKKDFRYIDACTGYDDNDNTNASTGYVKLLDLQEAGVATFQPFRNYYPHILAH